MSSITSTALTGLLNSVKTNEIDLKIKSPNAFGITTKIEAVEHNQALTAVLNAVKDFNDSTYNKLDVLVGVNVNGTLLSILDQLQLDLNTKHPLINPINTAFNKNFGVGGVSLDVPRFDDPRFVDERTPINNTVSTIKLQDNAVNNAKLADSPGFTLKGNNQSITASPQDLTTTQVRTLLNVENGSQVNFTGKRSITIDVGQYQLVNDVNTPIATAYYGTDSGGVRGFFSINSVITNYLNTIGGDNWGNQVIELNSDITSPLTNVYGVLEGTGVTGDELELNSNALQKFVEDVITFINPGDGWGSQVVNIGVSNGLAGNGNGIPLALNIVSNASLSGAGTGVSNLQIDEAWLTAFVTPLITGATGDDWGNQIVETSGIIEGEGTIALPIKLEAGDPLQRQILLWDHLANDWTRFNSTSLINLTQVYLDTDAPLTGTGTVSNPINFIAGSATNDLLAWNATLNKWEVKALASLPVTTTVITDGTSIIGSGTAPNPLKLINGNINKDVLAWDSGATTWGVNTPIQYLTSGGVNLVTNGPSGFLFKQKGLKALNSSITITETATDIQIAGTNNSLPPFSLNIAGGSTSTIFLHNLNTFFPQFNIYLGGYPLAGQNTVLNYFGTTIPTYLENLSIVSISVNQLEFRYTSTAACSIIIVITSNL